MRLEAGALAQPVVPGAQIVERGALDREREPTIDLGPENDLGEAQFGAGEIGPPILDLVIDNHPGRERAPPCRFDRGRIARLGLCADQAEQQLPHRRTDNRQLPIHPTLDMGARYRVLRVKPLAVAGRREIAADRVRFPHDEVAVDDGRHQAVGVELEIFGILIAAERPSPIGALISDVELGAAPQHLLHVGGARASPDLQHGIFLPDRTGDNNGAAVPGETG